MIFPRVLQFKWRNDLAMETDLKKVNWFSKFLYPKSLSGKLISWAVLFVAGALCGLLLYNGILKDFMRYENAVELVEVGDYLKALSEFKELDGYRDSESRIEELTVIAFQQYLPIRNYSGLAGLIALSNPACVDSILYELNPSCITFIHIMMESEENNSWGEIDSIGLIPMFSAAELDPIISAGFAQSEENKFQPTIIITDIEIFVGTVLGARHVGYFFETEIDGELTTTFPWDSLETSMLKVYDSFGEEYPEMDINKVTILVVESTTYRDVMSAIRVAAAAGFSESRLEIAFASRLLNRNNNLSDYRLIRSESGVRFAQPLLVSFLVFMQQE